MPIYEFRASDGTTKLFRRNVDERDLPLNLCDGKTYSRVTVPDSIFILGAHHAEDVGKKALNGYYQQELKHGSRFRSAFTAKQIKEAWA